MTVDAKFCCEKFARDATEIGAPVGAGMLYPPDMRPTGQFEEQDDGTWSINGCCGGGCYVVSEMRFCPYCGTKLSEAACQ